jgi:topoisomerase-4 subunit A
MLGENSDSKIALLSDREEAIFRITFVDDTKPAMEVLMSEFIEAKSPKAKGKRFSTLDVAKMEDITPEPEVIEEEVSEDSNEQMEQEEDSVASENTQEAQPIVDVPFTITNEVPEDSQLVDEQLTLF